MEERAHDAQRQLGWYRARLGNITGSQVGRLMKRGRSSYFGDDAMSYIYQLAAERTMAREILEDDEAFEAYLNQVNVTTNAMRFGTEMEAEARDLYCFENIVSCVEVGLCRHFDIEHFASSPDGIILEDGKKVALEIKCPTQAVFMRYCTEIKDNASLLKVKPEYFYQCMAHMMCTGAVRTDFIAFSPFQQKKLHTTRILPDESVFGEMAERINKANELINNII